VVIAWVAAKGQDIVPLIGARRREQLKESLGALDVQLTPEDIAAIEAAVPRDAAVGARYPEQQMAVLDSEKRAPGR
jgi:aryl-alcohol dehydrogenase-like predicted oxidoreductase